MKDSRLLKCVMDGKSLSVVMAAAIVLSAVGCSGFGPAVTQKGIAVVDRMPALPEPYRMLDWKRKAIDYDNYIFDFDSELPAGPMIWLDDAGRNGKGLTFGLYTAVNDARQGKDRNGGEFHESLNSLHALISAGLLGIDKTSENGYNYVRMVQNYFNSDNGWNIMMNNTCPEVAQLGGGYGRDWWYDVYPNVLYYAVCDLFPEVEGAEEIQRSIAEQFCRADEVLGGNYDYSYFDYGEMQGKVNHIPFQQDAAGGHANVLYSAYLEFGEAKYLEHAVSALKALESQTESRFYEILLPMGIYTAARLNAEQGQDFDLDRMLGWVFDGCRSKTGRDGWGITCGRWGDYDIAGLQGSVKDPGGYAVFMNSVDLVIPFVPMVKYAPEYAAAIGKWMLNCANSCRLFFPDQLPDANQSLPGMQYYTNSIIAYEGLIYDDKYGEARLEGVHPVATGDGPLWNKDNPKESMFSAYGTSATGVLGAVVDTTDVEAILKLDCNATDFYADNAFPAHLVYNPYGEDKDIIWKPSSVMSGNPDGKVDLFDIVSRKYLARNLYGERTVTIPSASAVLVYELPAGTPLSCDNGRIIAGNHIIAY